MKSYRQRAARSRPFTLAGCLPLVLLCCAQAAWAASSPGFSPRLAELQKQLATQPTNTALLFQLGDLCHDEGVKDNKEAVKLAEKYFRDLLKLDPGHAPALALLGSTYTLKGRDAFWPGTQFSLVKEGNKMMDAAAALATNNFTVRITRGLNNVHMPGFLGREDIARTDLAWVWEQLSANPELISLRARQEIALWYGIALRKAKQSKEAKAVWEQGLALDPKSSFALDFRLHLAKEK